MTRTDMRPTRQDPQAQAQALRDRIRAAWATPVPRTMSKEGATR